MSEINQRLSEGFSCVRCRNRGAKVERLSLSGAGISRWLDIQAHRFAFVSCTQCGYTEVYNLQVLEKCEDLGTLPDVLFAD